MPRKNATKDSRKRVWAFIVYPDSVKNPDTWKSDLCNLHIPGFISPLHHGEVSAKTGQAEKDHYHILLKFSGKKSVADVMEYSSMFSGVMPIAVNDYCGYCRYLCHLDDDDKPLYKTSDVVEMCGANYTVSCLSGDTEDEYLIAALDYIVENQVVNYARFMLFCGKNNREWFVSCKHNVGMVKESIRTEAWEMKNNFKFSEDGQIDKKATDLWYREQWRDTPQE